MQSVSGRISDGMAAVMLRENPGFVQASLSDPYEATRETILSMCGLVRESLKDPIVSAAASDAVTRFSGIPWASDSTAGKAGACWWWAKHAIKFVHHQKLFQYWGVGDGKELQLLISPDVLLRMEKPKGDCAVYTCLLCAMLSALGIQWEIVTVAVDPREPGVFSHVYPRAILENGLRLPLDASHMPAPGLEAPKNRYTGPRQVWDESGNAIQDQDPGYRGLHDVVAPIASGPASLPSAGWFFNLPGNLLCFNSSSAICSSQTIPLLSVAAWGLLGYVAWRILR